MTEKETGLPCLFDVNRTCDCLWVRRNAEQMNYFGRKSQFIRWDIQHQGYDDVSPALITKLLRYPTGGYYTQAFNDVYPFSDGMRKISGMIQDRRFGMLLKLEDNPNNIRCPAFREFLAKMKRKRLPKV